MKELSGVFRFKFSLFFVWNLAQLDFANTNNDPESLLWLSGCAGDGTTHPPVFSFVRFGYTNLVYERPSFKNENAWRAATSTVTWNVKWIVEVLNSAPPPKKNTTYMKQLSNLKIGDQYIDSRAFDHFLFPFSLLMSRKTSWMQISSSIPNNKVWQTFLMLYFAL